MINAQNASKCCILLNNLYIFEHVSLITHYFLNCTVLLVLHLNVITKMLQKDIFPHCLLFYLSSVTYNIICINNSTNKLFFVNNRNRYITNKSINRQIYESNFPQMKNICLRYFKVFLIN